MTAISNTRYDHIRRDFAWRLMDYEVRQCASIPELTEQDGTLHYGVKLQDHCHDVICAPMRTNSNGLTITDITSLGADQYRFNFLAALDVSVIAGDFLHVKGADQGNNGRYAIISKGTAYAVIVNADGAAQATGGSVQCAISYSPMIETQSSPSAGQYSPDYTSGSAVVRLNASRDTEYFVLQYEGGGTADRIGVGGNGSGSGSGATGINYITNGRAEDDTAGWSTYKDAASSLPVDGIGGSPNVTWIRSEILALRDDASFVFSKDANNRQGEGVSYDFSIDRADCGQSLAITFDHEIVSGSYDDGDVIAYIYDVTNSRLIEPAGMQVMSGGIGIPFGFVATFQASIDSTDYRLILHVSSTNASAYSLKFDSIGVGPQTKTYGVPITDMQEFGPLTIGATTTPPTKGTVVLERALWSRIGSYAFISYEYVQSSAGSAGSGVYKYPMPDGLFIDHARAAFRGDDGITIRGILGHGWMTGDGTSGSGATVRAFDQNNLCLVTEEGSLAENGDSQYSFGNSDTRIHFTAMVPIAGWSSNVEMSDGADTRVCSFVARNASGPSLTAGAAIVTGWTIDKDTHGAYQPSIGYSVKVPGDYYVGCHGKSTGTTHVMQIRVNGTLVAEGQDNSGLRADCTHILPNLKAGDLITISSDTNCTWDTLPESCRWFLYRLSGPSQIAASERIFADYYVSSNYACNSDEAINFDTMIEDSHGCVTTGGSNAWKFTSPQNRRYLISVSLEMSPATASVHLWKNGADYMHLAVDSAGGAVATISLRLLAGEYISVNPNDAETITGGASPIVSMISIESLQ